VFAGESAEGLFSVDPVPGEVDLRRAAVCLRGCELAEDAVRPGGVVGAQVLGQYLAQMVLVADEQPWRARLARGGAPHVGLSVAMGITSFRIAPAAAGRLGRRLLVSSHVRGQPPVPGE
jgi:hypothetical protein